MWVVNNNWHFVFLRCRTTVLIDNIKISSLWQHNLLLVFHVIRHLQNFLAAKTRLRGINVQKCRFISLSMMKVLECCRKRLLLVQISRAAGFNNTRSQFHRRQSAIESLKFIGIALWGHFCPFLRNSLQRIVNHETWIVKP